MWLQDFVASSMPRSVGQGCKLLSQALISTLLWSGLPTGCTDMDGAGLIEAFQVCNDFNLELLVSMSEILANPFRMTQILLLAQFQMCILLTRPTRLSISST